MMCQEYCRIHFQWLTVLLLFLRAMLFHNCDLIGKAISEFTGLDLPFKKSDFGQEPGMKMLSWTVSMLYYHLPPRTSRILILSHSSHCILVQYPCYLISSLTVLARESSLSWYIRPQASVEGISKQRRTWQAWFDVCSPMRGQAGRNWSRLLQGNW